MAERCFTPRTARRTLRAAGPAAERLCRLYRGLEFLRPARVVPDQPVQRDYFVTLVRMHEILHELRELGVLVKDARQGLLDFPARRAGRRVLLCWRVGEPSLAYWHESESGFAGRRPVDDEGPWEDT